MTDIYKPAKRSLIMSRVRSANNLATEVRLIELFRLVGISGWRRKVKLFGKPDFVFPRHRIAVFVDGCFWHCCPQHSSQPDSNRAFWSAKLARNKQRDLLVTRTLRKRDWHVLRIWQHELNRRNSARCILRIRQAMNWYSARAYERRKTEGIT